MRSTLTRLAATPKLTPILAAAVLLALVATTFGYFKLSHTVTLSLDGHTTEVRSFGSTVGDVLEAEGVKTTGRDVVVPGPDSELIDGSRIAVRFARPLEVNLDGETETYWTTARTVSAALTDLDLRAQGAKLSTSRGATIDRDGLSLTIATPKALTVKIANRKPVRKNIPALTAKDALRQLGVGHDADDIVKPAGRVLKDGDKLVLTRVRTETKAVKGEKISFATTERPDDSLDKGETQVVREGIKGARNVTYKIVWHNGQVHRKTVLKQKLLRAAVPAIVRVGTREAPAAPAANFAGGSGPFDRIAQCESGGNWSINTGNGYYGGLQFSASTWHAYGGSGLPHQHSREQQIAVAQRMVAAQGGYGAWPHCGKLA